MAHTRVWEESHPVGTEDAALGDDRIRNLKVDLGERLEDLLYGFNVSDGTGDEATPGVKVLNFKEQASIATPSENQISLAAKESDDGKAELFWKDEDGDERQLTEGGQLLLGKSATPQPILHNTTHQDTNGGRKSKIKFYGEQSGGERSTLAYIEVAHDGADDDQKGYVKIMVNDGDDEDVPSMSAIKYSSNGTISVSQSISVLDEDNMASNSSVQVVTQQSLKKYVDDQIAAAVAAAIAANVTLSVYTNQDSENNAMLKAHAYKASTGGWVTAYCSVQDTKILTCYVGLTNDPAGAGAIIQSSMHADTDTHDLGTLSVSALVAKDEYFEITYNGTNTPTIRWKSYGALSKPVDQEP